MDTWVGLVFLVIGINIASLFMGRKWISILAFLLLLIVTILSAIRSNIGEDYSGYIPLFFICDISDEILPYPEISFQILTTLIKKYELGYQCMFAFYSVFIGYFIWKSAKIYTKDRKYVLLFISLWVISAFDIGWWYSMNVIRQYLAIAILLYAYKYLIENNTRKYIVWCLVASFIHISALLMLVLPLLIKMNIRKRTYLVLVCIAVILSFTHFKYIWVEWIISGLGIYESYVGFVPGDSSTSLGLSSYFFLIQFLFLINKLQWHRKDEYILGVIISLCTIMKFILVRPYSRMTAYFSVVFIAAWIIMLCQHRIKQKALLIVTIMLFYSASFLYSIDVTQHGHEADERPSAGNITYEVNMNFFDDR